MWSSMADTDSNIKPQKLVSYQNQENPFKFYNNFLYKAVVVVIFLVILPLFPSQAPEFINQTVLTRSWEFLHLLFVGIAISYWLFSRRSDEKEKQNSYSKFDNAQSYVSRFLQVSSVFEDEAEIPSGSYENKVQTWNNQYYRNEPTMVVVAQQQAVLNEQKAIRSRISEKPLLLPVRSLKISDPGVHCSASLIRSDSKLGSKSFASNSNKARDEKLGGLGLGHINLEGKLKENIVLPSPIPWRSRSGRMEIKEVESPPLHTVSPSMEEFDLSKREPWSSRSQRSRSSRPNSTTSSPKLSSPPPISPPPIIHESYSMKARSSSIDEGEKNLMEAEENFVEKSSRKTLGYDPMSLGTKTSMGRGSVSFVAKPNFKGITEEEKEEFVDRVIVETDEEDIEGRDDDDVGESSSNNVATSSNVSDEGPDVDKKADEFIARFREQIKLQRIQSIKKSSTQLSGNSSR
ncbi:putative Hydroxyproline-rich glycoprotein family protein [Quillaja saponaria]|uniref:Hydroxyproline-rich glycoprotein family protein n=1 Tax=Quillaja saponaria TaxID=32244 RepID=A0AAD7P7L3_QUISA|nr:putative Hydroxyproline-rich glycoprotein family protein [Quillaja saponaria]